MKPIESLSQLANRDSKNLEDTFIFKLAKDGTLKYFRKLVFVASKDDAYVPWHSARVQPYNRKGDKHKI